MHKFKINCNNCRCRNLADYIRIAEKVKVFFHNEGIHSTTIQPEFVEVTKTKNHVFLCSTTFNRTTTYYLIHFLTIALPRCPQHQ